MQHRDPSPSSVTAVSRALVNFRERACAARPPGPGPASRRRGEGMAPASWYMAARDPIGIALAATSLAIPAAGAFVATEHVVAGVVLIVLAWVALLACCLDLLQAMWKAGVRRDRRKLARIAACPAPLERGASNGAP